MFENIFNFSKYKMFENIFNFSKYKMFENIFNFSKYKMFENIFNFSKAMICYFISDGTCGQVDSLLSVSQNVEISNPKNMK